jgi:hypothetical protein
VRGAGQEPAARHEDFLICFPFTRSAQNAHATIMPATGRTMVIENRDVLSFGGWFLDAHPGLG